MADTETPEKTAEEIAAETTTETTTEEIATDPPAEAEPTAAEKAKEWDKDKQKRDEARAAKEKARDEAIEAQALKQQQLEAEIAELKKAKTPPPPTGPTATELQAMADEVEALNDPANDKYDLDAARKIEGKLRRATLERQHALDERLKAQEAKDAESAAESRWWAKWKQDHPDCDYNKAKAIVDEGWSKFSGRYNGPALGVRVAEELDDRLEETRKSPSSPAPRVPPKKTAPAASASAPAGTKVTPVTGARQEPIQKKQVGANLLAYWRRNKTS